MAKKRFVDYDPINGITTSMMYDVMTDTTTLITEYSDCEDRLDINKALQNDPEYWRKGVKAGLAHFAHIPNSIINKWLVEEHINVFDKNDEKKVAEKLYSPEYQFLRTAPLNKRVMPR